MLEKQLLVVYLEFKLTGLQCFILLNLPNFSCQGNCFAQSHMAWERLSPDRSDPEPRPPAVAKKEGQGGTGSGVCCRNRPQKDLEASISHPRLLHCSLSRRLQAPVRVGKVWAPWGRGGDQGYMSLLLPVLPSELVKTQPRPPQPSPPPT